MIEECTSVARAVLRIERSVRLDVVLIEQTPREDCRQVGAAPSRFFTCPAQCSGGVVRPVHADDDSASLTGPPFRNDGHRTLGVVRHLHRLGSNELVRKSTGSAAADDHERGVL
jgi:hypothetical protein